MKKNFLTIAVLAIIICLSSCKSSSSFENDVKKMGNFRCKMQKLQAKDPDDEKVKKELEELGKEMDVYGEKMRVKYEAKKDDKEMEAKATAIMNEILEKCK